MSATLLEVLASVVACAAAGGALVLRDPRGRYGAIGLGLLAAVALIAGQVADQNRFESLIDQPAVLVFGLVLAAATLGATAATFARVPAAFALAAFAVLGLRVPVQVGGETNFLLMPLYGVIAGAYLRGVWLLIRGRGEELCSPSSPDAGESPLVRAIAWAVAVSLVLYGVGVAWTEDAGNATRIVAFFLVPFAAMLALLRDLRWYRKLVGRVLLVTGVAAAVFAAIAIGQYAGRELLLNEDLKDANELHLYFRVNSLFRDPNVLGRYLVFAIIGLAAYFAWPRRRLPSLGAAALAAVLLTALAFTFSITSFASLLAGLGVLLWVRLGRRGLLTGAALVVAGLGVFALAGSPADSGLGAQRDLAEATAGRSDLISGGVELFERRPIVGHGSGSFAVSFRREIEMIARPVSHSEPVTVAAEQGLVGLVPYAALLVLAVLAMVRPWPARSDVRAGIVACFAALLVHSLGYAGFFIDPATWALLALAVVARTLEPSPAVASPPPAAAAS